MVTGRWENIDHAVTVGCEKPLDMLDPRCTGLVANYAGKIILAYFRLCECTLDDARQRFGSGLEDAKGVHLEIGTGDQRLVTFSDAQLCAARAKLR